MHWVAMNEFPEAVKTNIRLLEEGNWLDVPIIYGSGRRAVLAIEKGEKGREVFASVIQAWEDLALVKP